MKVNERRVDVEPGLSVSTWSIDGRTSPAPGDPQVDTRRRTDAPQATFLLVHGLASNARLWDMTALELARLGHRVAAVDLRGHGESDKPDHGYDFPTLISDIVTIANALDLEMPILAGQSLGANLVLEAAWQHPDLATGVACVDGGTIELGSAFPDWEDAARVLAPPKLTGTESGAMRAMMRSAHPSWPESGIGATMANFAVRDDGTVAPRLSFDNHMRILRSLWEHKPSQRFADLQVPVLFVFAGGSGFGPPGKRDSAKAAEEATPQARVHWFEDADHDIHAQHPVELAALLDLQVQDGFFASHPTVHTAD
jgi:pimeloyl-ACP methyl ester carboxylesterase